MFSKIGKKIKEIAEVLCRLLIIVSLIAGLIIIPTVDFIIGIAVIIIGAICSLFTSFLLYGFGELIDKTVQNEQNTAEIKNLLKQQIAKETEQENVNKTEQQST